MPKRSLDPLPSAAFHILLALADNDLHGYAVMRQVAEQTDGRVRLGPGTLYGALSRLEIAGEVEQLPLDGRRRPYRLTESGRGTLERRLATLHRAVSTGIERVAS